MKPYNERLPMIDEIVEKLGGKLDFAGSISVYYAPEMEGKYCPFWLSRNNVFTNGELVCTRQEFEQRAKELGYPKEQDMNNDWYEKGELPPANTECEVRIEGQWLPTVVIGHYANEAVVVDPCVTVQRFFCTTANNLRPLRT